MRLKAISPRKRILNKTITLHIKEEDLEKIKALADKYAQGNLSAWIRYAAVNHTPKKSDLE